MYKQLLSFLLLILSLTGNAQQPKIKPVQNKNLPPLNTDALGVKVFDLQLFEQPDYQGKTGYFTKMTNGTYKAPFPLTNCSFKVPRGKIVYIKTMTEFPSEAAFTENERKANLTNVVGVRSDDLIGVIISFNGISTAIHNRDCRKVYGSIKIMLQENAPDADSTMSNMMRRAVPREGRGRRLVLTGNERWTFMPWKYANAAEVPSTQGPPFNKYILNSSPEPVAPPHPQWNDIVYTDPYEAYFHCGKKALQEGRLKFHFTTDLGTAHKTCDLCDDFSASISMKPAYEFLPLRNYYGPGELDTSPKNFMLGPYEARGSRDGFAITATAGTVKQFKVYYSMKLHQP